MTVRSVETSNISLRREALYAVRYYLGNRWALVGLIVLAAAIGLYFGGWGWLVAAGLAPLILSTLPCLVMCGLGVCMMCRGTKQSTVSRDAADGTAPSVALTAAKIDDQSATGSSCCHQPTHAAPLPQRKQLESVKEAGGSHA